MATDTANSGTCDDCICGWQRVRMPDACRSVDIVIGIDEAGRGPVLGSLVYCAAFWPVSEHEEICKLGFNDSKQLKESDRDKFFDMIRDHPSIGWVIEELTAEKISEEMLRWNPTSLNTISYDAVIRALEKIRDSPNAPGIKDIFIDTVGDPETYKGKLQRALGNDFANFVIEKKADATYKVVGAASIIAKVTRDTSLKQWVWKEGAAVTCDKNFGSGYPSDEVCVKWLAGANHKVFGYPNLIRFSWSTCKEALNKAAAANVEWACEQDEIESGCQSISNFFSGKKQIKRAPYFEQRKMQRLTAADLNAQL